MIDFSQFKKIFLYTLVGSLIISAIVGIITVLVGQFDEITAKVLLTLFMVIIHSVLCLGFIWSNKKNGYNFSFFSNVLFFLIVFSFITSILGIWNIFEGSFVGHLYQTFFVIGLSALHGNILSVALKKKNYMDKIIYANFAVIIIVAAMLFPAIYSRDAIVMLGEFYFRILGAFAIIDGTLSVITMIFYKIHQHNNVETSSTQSSVLKQSTPIRK